MWDYIPEMVDGINHGAAWCRDLCQQSNGGMELIIFGSWIW